MNGIISFVIFWDWLLLLSVCFWGLSVLQHAPVLHLSPPPRFFLSARLCVLPLSIHVAGGAVVSSRLIQLTFIDCCCVPDTSLGAYYFTQSTLHLSSTCHTWGHSGFLFYFSLCLYVCVCVFKDLFIYFWLRWVFLAAWAFSGVASGATLRCSVWIYCDGFPRGAQALSTRASVVVAPGP